MSSIRTIRPGAVVFRSTTGRTKFYVQSVDRRGVCSIISESGKTEEKQHWTKLRIFSKTGAPEWAMKKAVEHNPKKTTAALDKTDKPKITTGTMVYTKTGELGEVVKVYGDGIQCSVKFPNQPGTFRFKINNLTPVPQLGSKLKFGDACTINYTGNPVKAYYVEEGNEKDKISLIDDQNNRYHVAIKNVTRLENYLTPDWVWDYLKTPANDRTSELLEKLNPQKHPEPVNQRLVADTKQMTEEEELRSVEASLAYINKTCHELKHHLNDLATNNTQLEDRQQELKRLIQTKNPRPAAVKIDTFDRQSMARKVQFSYAETPDLITKIVFDPLVLKPVIEGNCIFFTTDF